MRNVFCNLCFARNCVYSAKIWQVQYCQTIHFRFKVQNVEMIPPKVFRCSLLYIPLLCDTD